jgi:dTDP-glucose 4,6-dehydratase
LSNPLADDLANVLDRTRGLWEELRGQRLFITGGTGFFGCWLLETFAFANDQLELDAEVWALTRNPRAFAQKCPHLAADPAIRLLQGDVRNFEFPSSKFSHVIHAATTAGVPVPPLETLDTIIQGTRHTLDFAVACGAKKLLLTSSGAVYGKQPAEMTHIPETYLGGPDPCDPAAAYGEGKRVAELLCAIYHQQHGLEITIARCFAFVGPHLPLDAHFAIGNFIRDALAGGPITIRGDGTPHRSYLYAADLAVWLWTILMRGKSCHPYNVGSDESFALIEVAEHVAATVGADVGVKAIGRSGGFTRERYVPNIARSATELGLYAEQNIDNAIRKVCDWQAVSNDVAR